MCLKKNEFINSFELNPVHYLSTPVFDLKLISEMGNYQFIESMIRKGGGGGISIKFKG